MPSGIDTMTVFVHQSEFAAKEQQVIAGLHRAVQPDSIDLESDLALIAVVRPRHEKNERHSRKDFLCTGACTRQR